MKQWEQFSSFKKRGEWVELLFMAAASARGFNLSRPWGDSGAYDVVIEHRASFLRVQVKGFSARKGKSSGYLCRLRHGGSGAQRYHLTDLDLFALYILPAEAWYIIPSATVLLPKPKLHLTVYPEGPPRPGRHTGVHDFEPYRNAWHLLAQDREELAHRRTR